MLTTSSQDRNVESRREPLAAPYDQFMLDRVLILSEALDALDKGDQRALARLDPANKLGGVITVEAFLADGNFEEAACLGEGVEREHVAAG